MNTIKKILGGLIGFGLIGYVVLTNISNQSAISQMRGNVPANTMMYFEGKGNQTL